MMINKMYFIEPLHKMTTSFRYAVARATMSVAYGREASKHYGLQYGRIQRYKDWLSGFREGILRTIEMWRQKRGPLITYIVDVRTGEIDILANLKQGSLVIRSLDGAELYRQQAPLSGWTFETLSAVQPIGIQDGADAYIDDHWVGSTEV